MNIIVVNDYGSVTGGAAQVAIVSLNALAAEGYNVTFISSVSPVDRIIDTSKVRLVNFGHSDLLSNSSRTNAAFRGIWDFECSSKLKVILNDYNVKDTIIHFHTWTKSLSPSVFRAALDKNFKIVVTLHDYFAVCPNGGLYNYKSQTHCSKKPMSFGCALSNCDVRGYAQKQWRFARHLVQKQFSGIPKSIRNFISISDYSENILRPYLPDFSKFYRVRNPIDVLQKPNVKENISDGFVFVGRLGSEKGGDLFARAAKEAKVRAVFIGQGPQENHIRRSNPNAVIMGWQDRSVVVQEIKKSKSIVFPSLWHETQGLVVSEAAALGVTAIVSDCCAAKDSIIDGKTGLLFKGGDLNDLITKLRMIDNNTSFEKELGKNAYDFYWEDPSTPSTHAKELIMCYEDILLSTS